MQKGQVSTELLVLIGLVLLLMFPLLIYSRNKAEMANENMAIQKAEFAAQRMASAADSVGYLGGSAKIIEEIEVPSNIKRAYVNGHDIVFELETSNGITQVVKSSAFNLTSSGFERIKKSGTYYFEVSALPLGSSSSVQIKVQ
ncbi:MAG: hypothetical protein N3G22_02345 [Candidatus Micrarchaeota archaeon]|nr:hypothetical protein [Candidatus Micrarchaeota archaeon]